MPAVPTLDVKPFYAYVGAGNAAIESLRARVTTLPAQVKELQGQVAQLPVLAATLPTQVKELQATFGKRYNDFASRGEKLVTELRGGKAKTVATTPAATPAPKPAVKKPVAKTS